MNTHAFEIIQRQPGEHRAGSFGLLIEGIDADICVRPGQFLGKALRDAAAEGLAGVELAARAEAICQQYAAAATSGLTAGNQHYVIVTLSLGGVVIYHSKVLYTVEYRQTN